MTDEQITMLLSLGIDEARLLLDGREYSLYRRIREMMVKLVRDYDVQLPLNCLQFVYCENRLSRQNKACC
jgi:hypothetical protein